MMTNDTPSSPTAPGPLAALAERLIYLKQRARHCRRVAQACGNSATARTLETMAERFEAEARTLSQGEAQS